MLFTIGELIPKRSVYLPGASFHGFLLLTESSVQQQFVSEFPRPRCYDKFKAHLAERGFVLYPREFDCIVTKHPLVDIAAKMGSNYWAFEYKSEFDNVSKSIEQLKCYSLFFDFVVLVSEKLFDHRSSNNYWNLKHLGAGIWFYVPNEEKCIEKIFPQSQYPQPPFKRFVRRKFRSYFKAEAELSRVPPGSRQSLLTEFSC
jgi:hypothetical protein